MDLYLTHQDRTLQNTAKCQQNNKFITMQGPVLVLENPLKRVLDQHRSLLNIRPYKAFYSCRNASTTLNGNLLQRLVKHRLEP